MRKNYIKIEKLTLAAYSQFGSFSNLINPNTEKIGASPVEFFRDQLQTPTTSNQNWSYSCCKVEKRPLVIDTLGFILILEKSSCLWITIFYYKLPQQRQTSQIFH